MKKLLIIACVISFNCKSNQEKLRPIVDVVKKYYIAELPQIDKIDSVYLLVDIITPKSKMIFQAMEYQSLSTKYPGYKETSERFDSAANSMDSTTLLYYRVQTLVLYKKLNTERELAGKEMFFDRQFNIVDKYSIIKPVDTDTWQSKTDIIRYNPEIIQKLIENSDGHISVYN